MAQAQKPDFVFRRNGRVHLNRRGSQFSRLLAAEVCTSALVMLDTPHSEVVWEYWLPTPSASFPFTFPPVRHRVPSGFKRTLHCRYGSETLKIRLHLGSLCAGVKCRLHTRNVKQMFRQLKILKHSGCYVAPQAVTLYISAFSYRQYLNVSWAWRSQYRIFISPTAIIGRSFFILALGVPGRLRPRIFSTFGTTRVVGRQPNAPATFTPGEIPGTHFQRLSRPQDTWFCRFFESSP